MIARKQTYKQGTLKLARPVFVVLYNGIDSYPAKSILKLSDSFDEPVTQVEKDSFIELQALVINIHAPENAELVKKSPYLNGYVEVVRRGRAYQAQGMDAGEAVTQAIQDCINAGIIADYLRQHASEVIGMLTEQFNLDEALWEIKNEGLVEGEQIGIGIGEQRKADAMALRMHADHEPVDKIARYTGCSYDYLTRLFEGK
jgi:hypothetical protein